MAIINIFLQHNTMQSILVSSLKMNCIVAGFLPLMGMVVWFNNPIWFITTMQYYFITLVILMSISDLIHILIYGVRFFFYTHFLYVIYYCSKFQLFKICQLVYSPLFSLITVTLLC